jgi:putative acetyltransferase
LLLGLTSTLVAGVVGLRPLNAHIGEVKRLYVRPAARRRGTGRMLMTTLIGEARRVGYRSLCLETLEAMIEARALYHSLGFREIARYRPTANADDRTISMALEL